MRAKAVESAVRCADSLFYEGQYALAMAEVERARQIEGYERSSILLNLRNRIGERGRRVQLADGWVERESEEFAGFVISSAVSPDGRRLVVCEDPFTGTDSLNTSPFTVWDMETGRRVKCLDGMLANAAFTSDSRRILVTVNSGVRLYDVVTAECVQLLDASTDSESACYRVCVSEDGSRAITGGDSIRLWDLPRGLCLNVFHDLATDSMHRGIIWLSPDGRWGIGADSAWLHVYDFVTQRRLARHAIPGARSGRGTGRPKRLGALRFPGPG